MLPNLPARFSPSRGTFSSPNMAAAWYAGVLSRYQIRPNGRMVELYEDRKKHMLPKGLFSLFIF